MCRRRERNLALHVLARVPITASGDRSVNGQGSNRTPLRRVIVAMALAREPDLPITDEPTTGLLVK